MAYIEIMNAAEAVKGSIYKTLTAPFWNGETTIIRIPLTVFKATLFSQPVVAL